LAVLPELDHGLRLLFI